MSSSIKLASGDFILEASGGKTYLTALAPFDCDQQIRCPGNFNGWDTDEWNALIEKSRRFSRTDLISDLKDLRNDALGIQEAANSPLVNDDAGEEPEKVHTLEMHYSRDENYIIIRGTSTHEHGQKLLNLGFLWDSEGLEWKAGFSERLLELAGEYVHENGYAYDPTEIDYERCTDCGRWKPKECRCPHNH